MGEGDGLFPLILDLGLGRHQGAGLLMGVISGDPDIQTRSEQRHHAQ